MSNQNPNNTYTIQQVSDLTGLSKQVIRKWEERYNLIQPERLENGYRIYSHQEVTTLLRIQALADNGMTVKQAIAAINNEKSVPSSQTIFKQIDTKPQFDYATQVINNLLKNSFIGNDIQMLNVLQQAHHTLGIKSLIYDVIIPFLHEVGKRWYDGELEEFQEALASLVIRDFLANLRRNLHMQEDAPLVLGSCLPNERHEIPLHILMLQILLLGYRSIMLGSSPAPGAIQNMIEQTNPKIVILSALTTAGFKDAFKIIDEIDDFAGKYPHIRFYIGGPGASEALMNHPLQHIQLTNDPSDIFKEIGG